MGSRWCFSKCQSWHCLPLINFNGIVHLEAKINAQSKPGIADLLEIKLMHGPIARTFLPATEAWIQEQQAKAANREVEKAKQQGVKLAL